MGYMLNTKVRNAMGAILLLLLVGCSQEDPPGPNIPALTPPIEFDHFGYFDGGSRGWRFRDSTGTEIKVFCAHSSDDPGFAHPEGVVPGGYYLVTDLDGIGIGDLDDSRLIPVPSIAARRIADVAQSITQEYDCGYPWNDDEEPDLERLERWRSDLIDEHGVELADDLRSLAILEHILRGD